MKIETDLQYIEKMGAARDDENWAFRSFLKQASLGSDELDLIVHRIIDEVTSQIDCTTCGNCCKRIKPVLDQEDIAQFSHGLSIPVSEFRGKYLHLQPESTEDYTFKGKSCPFLKDKRCSNYAYRPKDCHSYPHLHKDNFRSRLFGVLDNYSICPIVFNVYDSVLHKYVDGRLKETT